jgi:sodium-dependent dicarboxylate transporter 2/3/5
MIPCPQGMPAAAMKVAAVAVLMALWWITEAIPIPATALLPIALFPTLGVMSSTEVTRSYANHLIYLFMGGFMIAVTMEKWNLHKRIALTTVSLIGVSPNQIILGFMVATAFLSMWISNTATTMMMLPIGLAVIRQSVEMLERNGSEIDTRPGHFRFGTALMLGIAYSASIGGVATLIGTPPNAILVGIVEETYGSTISFASWIGFGLPLSIVMLLGTWVYLTRIASRSEVARLPGGRELIRRELARLGTIQREEKYVLGVFLLVATAWILRGIIKVDALSLVHDSTIAIAGAILLFLIPSNLKKREFLLDWSTAVKIPWDVIILFGGGFALAAGFSRSGLTVWIAGRLTILEGADIAIVTGIVALLVIFLTEITSNTATASLSLPIMAAISEAMQVHPYGLMIATAIAASFAFMMPVATPPNAIVYGSRYVSIPQMAKIGFWINIIGAILLTLFVILVLPILWNIDLGSFPIALQ